MYFFCDNVYHLSVMKNLISSHSVFSSQYLKSKNFPSRCLNSARTCSFSACGNKSLVCFWCIQTIQSLPVSCRMPIFRSSQDSSPSSEFPAAASSRPFLLWKAVHSNTPTQYLNGGWYSPFRSLLRWVISLLENPSQATVPSLYRDGRSLLVWSLVPHI